MIKVMVVGGGAREDAVCRKLARDGAKIYSVLSNLNPSILSLSTDRLIARETESRTIVSYAEENEVDLVFVGPDPALATDLVDSLIEKGIRVASPTRKAAEIETSKAFMRELVDKYKIPGQVDHRVFTSTSGLPEYLAELGDYAVKPLGLTGGKGVRVKGDHFRTDSEGLDIAARIIGSDGSVLIERKIIGEEFSLQAFSDGENLSFMPVAQDYKRAFDGDMGPNTGGMGSITDSDHGLPFISKSAVSESKEIMLRILHAMRSEDREFRGILYGQFMETSGGTRIIEINSRFADPEGINALFLMDDSLLDVLFGISDGKLSEHYEFMKKATVLKYVVPPGYGSADPEVVELHVDPGIAGSGSEIFYASVSGTLSDIRTTRSRSLAVISAAESIPEAAEITDSVVNRIRGRFHYRKDIGTRESLDQKIRRMESIRSASPP